jgi:hypothetical protein
VLQSRDFPAWVVGALIAAGCATAESEDVSDGLSNDEPTSGKGNPGGSSSSAGSAGKLTAGGTGPGQSGSGGASAGTASGGKASGGSAGNATGGSDEGGSAGSGGADSGGKAGAGGKGGTSGSSGGNPGGSGGKAGSSAGGSGGTNSGGSGGGGSGGGGSVMCPGGKLGCDDPLYALCDDFEDGDAACWSVSGGTWTVVQAGSQVYRGAVGGYQAYVGDPAMTDQIVEAKLTNLVFGGSGSSYRIGLMARRTSTSNFYAATLDEAGDLRVLKGSSGPSGSSGQCDSVAVSPPAAGFTLRLEVTGPSGNVHIKTFLDGDPIHDCTTTSGTLAAGAAGVYTYGSKSVADFDDFKLSIP